jgi:GABA(A) receptor-associated protein
MSFKSKHTLSERLNETKLVLEKYPDRLPIICEKNVSANKDCPIIDKNKYLIPNDLTIGQFMYVIRKRMKLKPEKAIFLFINGFIPSSSSYVFDLYLNYKDEDNYLYINYSSENTFGT